MIRWLGVGVWYILILYTSSLSSTPDTGRPFLELLNAKAGHVFVYCVLGVLLTDALLAPQAGLGLRSRLALGATICTGLVLASIDETRQLFVWGRTGQPSDVLLDTLALSGGALLYQRLLLRFQATLAQQPTDEPRQQRPPKHEHQ